MGNALYLSWKEFLDLTTCEKNIIRWMVSSLEPHMPCTAVVTASAEALLLCLKEGRYSSGFSGKAAMTGQPAYDGEVAFEMLVEEMMAADVVLTTYPILREEVYYVDQSVRTSSLRHAKRYPVIPSPLRTLRYDP